MPGNTNKKNGGTRINKQFLVVFMLHMSLEIRIFTLVITKGKDARKPRKSERTFRTPAG
ncbi:hypothetical protein SDC9_129340 [bioreactor metagenome]|uniref:Uncharacterized protein n=1 Tax=bioreactor metagenome TaxID=1076179 RepID=A0A645CZD8_9ZZZZ